MADVSGATNQMSTLLITGTSGYIGSHFAKYFTQKGLDVLGIDEVPTPKRVKPFLKGDLCANIGDRDACATFLTQYRPQAVIHCAAKALVKESVEKPDMYFDNNVEKAQIFLDLCIEENVRAFLFSSTAAVYGEPIETPITETHPRNPINPYGASKKAFEDVLLQAHEEKKITAGILRYFNACGADPDAELGEDHEPETHLIPNLIRSIIQNKELCVFGDSFDTNDGTCVRDYIHVWDLAEAHALLLDKLLKKSCASTVFNLGTANGYSIMEIIQTAQAVLDPRLTYRIEDPRPGDPGTLIADASRARDALGWKPAYSDLETILRTAYAWHQKHDQNNIS